MFEWIKGECTRIGRTAAWSWAGWTAAWAREKSIKQWFIVNVLSAALAFSLELDGLTRGVILAFGLLILVVELINSAIEEVVDYISLEIDPRAKRAKDYGSAAVALVAIAGGILWVFVLFG